MLGKQQSLSEGITVARHRQCCMKVAQPCGKKGYADGQARMLEGNVDWHLVGAQSLSQSTDRLYHQSAVDAG